MTIIVLMLLNVTGKVLLDRNTLYRSIHHIHGYYYCLLSWLPFIMYTITIDCYTVPLLSPHRLSIISNMDIDCHNWIK